MSDSTNDNNTTSPDSPKRLYRLPNRGMIAGIAAGLAEYFNVDVTIMRIIFVVLLFVTSGAIALFYLIAIVIIPTPEEESLNPKSAERKVDNFAKDFGGSMQSSSVRNWLGVGLIIFGAWLLLRILLPDLAFVQWNVILPVMLIGVGLLFIVRGNK